MFLLLEPAHGSVLYEVVDLGTVGGAFRSEARGVSHQDLAL